MPIPRAAILWTNIAMDSLIDLPTLSRFATILVAVYRFSKMIYLILPKNSLSAEDIAAFFENIFKLDDFPSSIIYDHDLCL